MKPKEVKMAKILVDNILIVFSVDYLSCGWLLTCKVHMLLMIPVDDNDFNMFLNGWSDITGHRQWVTGVFHSISKVECLQIDYAQLILQICLHNELWS